MPSPKLDKYKGKYYAFFSIGKRSKRKSMGTADRTVAEARFAQWLLLGGHRPTSEQPEHVSYSVKDCYVFYKAKHVEDNIASKDTFDYCWKNLGAHFNDILIDGLTQEDIDKYVRLRAAGKIGRPAKPQTCRRELNSLIAALNFCANPPYRMIEKSSYEGFKLPKEGAPRDRWLRPEEIKRLLDTAASQRDGNGRITRVELFLWVALQTAARKQAILDLTWDRVDFETGVIQFHDPGKDSTSKKRANVPISAQLRPILKQAHDERVNDFVMENKSDVWKAVQRIAMKSGFTAEKNGKRVATGVSPHVLRHTAATHMARAGVPLWRVAKILGNTIAVTEKVYAKWYPDNPDGSVNNIDMGL